MHCAIESVDIVGQIALSVDVLRLLDPTGYLLDRIVLDIKSYIMSRADGRRAILQVISSLAKDPDYASLFLSLSEVSFDGADAMYFDTLPDAWSPDPIEAADRKRILVVV